MSNKNTSNKSYYQYNTTEEKMKKFDLSYHLVDLLWNEPFYSRILRSLNKIESTEVPTAGVIAQDGEFTLYWNREFLSSLSNRKILGLLKHECLHLLYEHTTTRRRDPHIIWNWAADLAINSQLDKKELPKGGLIPGEKLPKLSADEISKMSSEEIVNHNEISNLIASLPSDKTSEFYFSKLIKNNTIKQMLENAEMSSLFGKLGMDSHDGWDEMSDEERDMIANKLKDIMKDAALEANEKGWGSCSKTIRQTVNKFISNQVSWKNVLKRFCGQSIRQNKENSINRLNRKYPLVHPGSLSNYTSKIAVYIDESGSVDNKSLEAFYGELNGLSKCTDFWIYKFDTQVNVKEGFLWKQGKKVDLKRTQIGGTCFVAPTKHGCDPKNKFDGYIIFTDGIAPDPGPSRVKRGWLLTKDGSLFCGNGKNYKKDIVIKLN